MLPLAVVSHPLHAITINLEYSEEGDPPPHDENPSWDSEGLLLKDHFQRAKQIWEALLPGPGEYEIEFHWDDDIDGLALATDVGIFDEFIEVNSTATISWYADPTLFDDREFNFNFTNAQVLYTQLGSNQSTWFPGTAPRTPWRRGLQAPAMRLPA